MSSLRRLSLAAGTAALLALSACGSSGQSGPDTGGTTSSSGTPTAAATASASAGGGHAHMHHDTSGAPEGMVAAKSPKYAVGSTVTVLADHMPGMKGATGKVVGVYDTQTYAVSYTSQTDGTKVSNHKWVVREETFGGKDHAVGDEVKLLANHMTGMQGATATIDSVTTEPVYMVDVTGTDGTVMKNHKWVTETELAAK